MKYSIVIPIYNEEECIEPLYFSLIEVFKNLKEDYEIIFINDFSLDNSLEVINNLRSQYENIKLLNFTKKSGKGEALQAGFDNARGEIIITIDGDGQFEPKDISRLLGKLNNGYDVVCGWRYKRSDPLLKKLSSKVANIFRRILLEEKIHDVGCSLRVYKSNAVKNIKIKGEIHRFLTALLLKKGCNITELKINHYSRRCGTSKYNIRNRLFVSFMDLFYVLMYKDNRTALLRHPSSAPYLYINNEIK